MGLSYGDRLKYIKELQNAALAYKEDMVSSLASEDKTNVDLLEQALTTSEILKNKFDFERLNDYTLLIIKKGKLKKSKKSKK